MGRSDDLLSFGEAGRLCGASPAVVRRWAVEDGVALGLRAGKAAIHWVDLHKCLARRKLPVPAELYRGPRLLLVDDDPDLLRLLVDSLADLWERAHVATASDGEQALRKLLALRPDLLVADICLPRVSGLQLCRRVRRSRELAHTKVLVLTGFHDPRTNRMALRCGADEYIPKPVAPEDLRLAALRLLGDFDASDRDAVPTGSMRRKAPWTRD